MENSIEFVAAWMGLAKIGVVTAWLNTGLKNEQLAHCLRTSECKAVICSEAMSAGTRTQRSPPTDYGFSLALKDTHSGGFIGDDTIQYFVSSASSALGQLATSLLTHLDSASTDEPETPDSVNFMRLVVVTVLNILVRFSAFYVSSTPAEQRACPRRPS